MRGFRKIQKLILQSKFIEETFTVSLFTGLFHFQINYVVLLFSSIQLWYKNPFGTRFRLRYDCAVAADLTVSVCVCVLQIYTISCMRHCTTSWSGVPFIAIISKRMNDLNRIVIWINQHGEWNKCSSTINMTDTSKMEIIMRNFIFNM